MVRNREVARLLSELALLTELDEGSPQAFRVRAYDNAARAVDGLTTDIDSLVENGKFRKDLFYRLNVFRMNIPPLRRRIDDIPHLSDFFADKYCIEFGKSHYELSRQTKAAFCEYHWPGNVDELETTVQRAVLQGDEESICKDIHLNSNNAKSENHDQTKDSMIEPASIEEYLRGCAFSYRG